jgi:hypothetical protein
MLKKTVQQGRRRIETGGVPSGYGEDFSEMRTKLAGVFSSRLIVRFEARRCLVEYGRSGAGEGFVVRVVEGIDAELD